MKARYDETKVTLTKGYIQALINLMEEECRMMGKADSDGEDSWHWGRCTIGDLSNARSLSFQYGAKDEVPNDRRGRFAVVVEQ